MLKDDLTSLGMEEKEAKVYLAVLELGEANVAEIGQKAGIKRTSVYPLLEQLNSRGFLGITKHRRRKLYFAQDPRKIKADLQEKLGLVDQIIPNLLAISNFMTKKPEVRYFEGLAGIKEIYKDILNYPDQELIGWWARDYNFGIINDDFFINYYAPKRLEKKIWVRGIAPDTEPIRKYKEKEKERLHNLKLVPYDKFPLIVEISMYGKDKVSIISFDEEIGLVIESKNLFLTLKSIFEMQWESLPDRNNHY